MMEALNFDDRDYTCFKLKPVNISRDDDNGTTEDEILQISDKESRLVDAVWQDNSSQFISLAKGSLDPGMVSRLLQLACRLDSVECTRVLIEGDTGTLIQINEMDVSGRTPLQSAAAMHSIKCIDLLLKKNARTDLRSKDEESLLALEIALSCRRMQIDWSPKDSVQELLVLLRERDLSAIRLLAVATKDVMEVAHGIAMEGHVAELAVLLLVATDKITAPVNSKTLYELVLDRAMSLFEMEKMAKYDGDSIRMCQKKRRLLLCEIELIQMLGPVVSVERDNCKKRKVLPPLLQASKNRQINVVQHDEAADAIKLRERLICFRQDPPGLVSDLTNCSKNQITSPSYGIGDEALAKLVLQADASANETDADGNSSLHLWLRAVSISHNLRLIWLLLKHGAKVSQQNRLGLTPIHIAAEKGNYQALQLMLLQAPECVDLASATQETPLFFAARNGFLDCVKLLLQYGANCRAINLRRQRPIDLASTQDIRFILNPANQGFLHTSPAWEDNNRDIFWSAKNELNNRELGNDGRDPSMKTEICRYYQSPRGCVRDAKCNFAHVDGELKQVPPFRNTRHRKIFVGGLPLTVDSDHLKKFFQAGFGLVEDATVITTKVGKQSQSRGFGFVLFKQEESVTKAVEAHFVNIFGKKVEIKSIETNYSLVSDSEGQILQSLPPWGVKFKKWLPAFLKRSFSRLGNREGYPLSSIKADFRATCGMELDHASLGFLKLSDFIRSFPDCCNIRMVPSGGNGVVSHMVLFPVNYKPQYCPSSKAIEHPEVIEDESSSLENKAGFGEGSLSFSPWRNVLDSVDWRLRNSSSSDNQPFSFFERQWDHYKLAQGKCTVCFSQIGSLSLIPCDHKVCCKCFMNIIQSTCIFCSGKVQGFKFVGNVKPSNPTNSHSI